jgi:hypothetical protein
MLELICHQRYRVSGCPVDLSPYRNHGAAIDAPGAPGAGLSHEVIEFPNPDSRVAIGLGSDGAWAPLQALKIEVTARVDTDAGRQLTLTAGDGAFVFEVSERALAARVGGDSIRSADADSPDGALHQVPANRWTRLGLEHDGFARLRLFIDGRLVAQKLATGGVPSVQAGGVAIGNVVGGGQALRGVIDEVMIWRLDPREMIREFLCRPMTPEIARCWEALAQVVSNWIKGHPAEAAALVGLANSSGASLVRNLNLLSEAEQAQVRGHLASVLELWCSGRIDGQQMGHALDAWMKELRRLGLHGPDHAAEAEALLADLDREAAALHCDPAVVGFLKRLSHAAHASAGKAN